MIQSFWAIVRNSFSQIVRQPIYAILLCVGLAMIALSPVITAFTMMDDVKLTVDMGLGTIFMAGIILSVLGATQVISDEIESRTAGAVISKPVKRFIFVLGKFIGVGLALALYSYLMGLMLLMTVRMGVPTTSAFRVDMPVLFAQLIPFFLAAGYGIYSNFFYRVSFTSAAVRAGFALYTLAFILLLFIGKDWRFEWAARSFAETDAWPAALASATVFFGVLVIASVALAASTRMGVVANIMICLTVFFTGMLSSYFFGWTVDADRVRWEPAGAVETAVISGTVSDRRGNAVEGVRVSGAPGRVVTGPDGRYEAVVRRGASGELSPEKRGYRFQPEARFFPNIEQPRLTQDFIAITHRPGPAAYGRYLWSLTARICYHVTPSLQLFWVGDQIMRPNPYIPASYVIRVSLYGLLWCAGMVVFAAFLFEGRELV